MRTLLSIALLALTSAPTIAAAIQDATIPEPGIISLIGIGALALLARGRGKK